MRARTVSLVLVSLLAAPLLTACGVSPERLGTAQEPISVCPGNSTLQGVDVSHFDGTVDWPTAQAAGVSFGFVKATEGDCFVDPMFGTNWPAMAQAGVVRSAYHFFHASVNPIAAADFHLQTMGPLRPGDLPPALDLEITDGEPADTITTNAIAWLDHVAAATGLLPILYVSPDFVSSTLGNPAGLESHAQLWIADWQVTCPDVPAPFATFGFWQNDSTGTVAGVGTNAVDTDVFNGSAADLAALTLPSPGGAGGSGGSSGAGGSSGTGGSGPGGSRGTGGSAGTSVGAGGSGQPGTGSGAGSVHEASGCAVGSAGTGSGRLATIAVLGMLMAGRRRRRRT